MAAFRRPSRALLAALAVAAAAQEPAAWAAELSPLEAQRRLAGTWAGEGTTLSIDIDRLQGNVDPEHPFDWEAFRLLNVSGHMVVFDIGDRRYLAILDPGSTMRLTSPSFVGERALHLVRR